MRADTCTSRYNLEESRPRKLSLFRNVSCDIIKKVLDYYYLDFQMFEYSAGEYLQTIHTNCRL